MGSTITIRELKQIVAEELHSVKEMYNSPKSYGHDAFDDVEKGFVQNAEYIKQCIEYWSELGPAYKGRIKDAIKRLKKQHKYTDSDIKKIKGIKKEDLIPGGLADTLSIADVAKKHEVPVEHIVSQVKKGAKVEKEHTDDIRKAAEIALDHVTEDCYYYDKLEKMENPTNEMQWDFSNSPTKIIVGWIDDGESPKLRGLDIKFIKLAKILKGKHVLQGAYRVGLSTKNKRRIFLTFVFPNPKLADGFSKKAKTMSPSTSIEKQTLSPKDAEKLINEILDKEFWRAIKHVKAKKAKKNESKLKKEVEFNYKGELDAYKKLHKSDKPLKLRSKTAREKNLKDKLKEDGISTPSKDYKNFVVSKLNKASSGTDMANQWRYDEKDKEFTTAPKVGNVKGNGVSYSLKAINNREFKIDRWVYDEKNHSFTSPNFESILNWYKKN